MTLPRRLVSLLLIYCFAAAVAPHPRIAVSSSNPILRAERDSSAVERVYDFFSSLFSSNGASSSDDENADKEEGLRFRLSEAAEQPEVRPVTNVIPATTLSDSETEAILKRLPPIKTDASDETEFAVREKSLPPPRTGTTVMQPFPAANEMAAPEQMTAGPLEVVRYSPDGDVPIAPNLSVTFSQPMVAITTQEEAAENVPVKLSPQPPGKWHWIGTKTLLFDPDVRFPMATHYSVTVPAGTKST
ncbi:MAG TPA: Ig-like domain-containing protein, partial [Pyrinomonadaceae bacterium]|nr:Ig-like domain-containing protein [Pyrinomonadaceae bacterium]